MGSTTTMKATQIGAPGVNTPTPTIAALRIQRTGVSQGGQHRKKKRLQRPTSLEIRRSIRILAFETAWADNHARIYKHTSLAFLVNWGQVVQIEPFSQAFAVFR